MSLAAALSPSRLPAIVLAGGASARMGVPKALLDLNGRTFLRHVCDVLDAGGVGRIAIVTGAHDASIRDEVARWGRAHAGATIVHNAAADADQLSSLLCGLDAVQGPAVRGVLVALVDHPFVTAATVRAVVACFEATLAPVVRPRCGGRHGHPVIFSRDVFGELRATAGPGGAKAVVAAHAASQRVAEVDDEGIWTDVDTRSEYEAALRHFAPRPR